MISSFKVLSTGKLPDQLSGIVNQGKFREGPRPAEFHAYFDRLRERFP